jgi:ABC-2 type transport system permease protein
MKALLLRLWRQHRLLMSIMSGALAGFAFILTRVAPEPGETGLLATLAAMVPKQILAMMGGEFAMASARGVIAFGYVHPFFLAILSAWTIRVTASALAGELGRGTMDLLAARPLPRAAHVLAAWLTTVAGLAILGFAAWTGTALGLQLRPLHVPAREIVTVPFMAWLLFTSWTGISLAISAMVRDAGPAISWASGLIVSAFVVVFLAQVWHPADWLRPFSPFAYFRPQEIVRVGIAASDLMTLGGLGLSTLALAVWVFQRRDL